MIKKRGVLASFLDRDKDKDKGKDKDERRWLRRLFRLDRIAERTKLILAKAQLMLAKAKRWKWLAVVIIAIGVVAFSIWAKMSSGG